MTDVELEPALRRLFELQARAVLPLRRPFGEAPAEPRHERPDHATRRPVVRAVLAAAAVLATVVGIGIVATMKKEPPRPGAPPLEVVTPYSRLRAQEFAIEIGDRRFTSLSGRVGADTAAGDAHSQTLELFWSQHGVPMRWYLYFASDGRDWWATEMRTYNGQPDGEWVTFTGSFFKRPLGTAFVGDLDVSATENGFTSHLSAKHLELQAFLDVSGG
jgi:hypothetical protein